jgi:hypothetical protein
MDEPVRFFHIPAYKGTDLFHRLGGTGGRSLNAFFFAAFRPCLIWTFSLRVLHFLREEEKERADPSAALMAAREKGSSLWHG